MADDAMDVENATYTLYGVIEHINIGLSLSFGHYIGYVKGGDNNWYMCNDEKVFEVDLQQVLNSKAYLLFYQRDNPRGAPEPQFSRNEGFKFGVPNACIQKIPSDEQIVGDLSESFENRPLNGQNILVRNQFHEELQSSKSSSSSQVSVAKTDGQWIADMVGGTDNTNGTLDGNSIESDNSNNDIKHHNNLSSDISNDNHENIAFCVEKQQIDENFESMESDEFEEVIPEDSQNLIANQQQQQIDDLNHEENRQLDSSDKFNDVNLNETYIENQSQIINENNQENQEQSHNFNMPVSSKEISSEESLQQNLEQSIKNNQQINDENLQNITHQINSDEFSEVIPDYTVMESQISKGENFQRVLDIFIQSDNYKCEVEFITVTDQVANIKLQQQGLLKVPLEFNVTDESEVAYNEQLQGVRIRFFEFQDDKFVDQETQ
eukprot:TRINITY_DN16120_c0_g2_i1.p1 TRINITY_DN16120_c0_g2~~TRINITY_DN16120_c0_g2_i1.p1  ORF type:complete len:436 (+),score=88.52 TRINITY_DN16120_c0_g2_i1:787-2094(+)